MEIQLKMRLLIVTGSVKFNKSRNPIKSLSVIKIENGSPKLQEKINP